MSTTPPDPILLPTVAECDAAISELLATTRYVNADGTPYTPDDLDVDDPIGDADMREDEDE